MQVEYLEMTLFHYILSRLSYNILLKRSGRGQPELPVNESK